MAWRFKVSKYKNAVGIVPRKEDWLTDIKVGSPQSCGNHVAASAAFVAFNVENRGGGSLAVLPLSSKGRFDPNSPLLHAHSDLVTDFGFSPFDDGMLITGSTDANVHIWHIPEEGLISSLSTPEYTLPQFDKRVENVLFHPTTEFIVSVSFYETVQLFDILHQREITSCQGATDQIQSTSWRGNGCTFVTSAKDRTLRIYDPRASSCAAMETAGHYSPKDSRVVWLGNTDSILSTGYCQNRIRELWLHDIRSFSKPYKTQQFDSSTGILMPLFDEDTRMLFLAGKADVSILFWEVHESEPFLTEGLKHTGGTQTKGACLVPKRGVDAMSGEVNRVLQLTSSALIPIAYQVPRKTFREFHGDLFPDTRGSRSAQTVQEWMLGGMDLPDFISLNPARRNSPTLQVHRGPVSKRSEMPAVDKENAVKPLAVDTYCSNGTNSFIAANGHGTPVPAPRTCRGGGVSSACNESSAATSFLNYAERNGSTYKPTVAVKPSVAPPMPALRSSVVLPSSRERNFNARNSDISIGNTSSCLTNLRRSIQPEKSGFKNHPSDNEINSNPGTPSDSKVEDEPASKLASLRAQFESRSNSDCCEDQSPPESVTDSSSSSNASVAAPSSPASQRRCINTRTRSFRRICKFRHLKGTPAHRRHQIENLRDLSRTTPGESDGIACNSTYVALPLSGAGGRISVMQHQKGGRLADGVIPAFLCSASILDFAFDPFNEDVLFTGCDDGNILQWRVPEDGLLRPSNEVERNYFHCAEKVTLLRPHPIASGVMAACYGDFIVRIWDLKRGCVSIALLPHPDQIFSAAWSPCGVYLATLCRDSRVRIFDPRKSPGPCADGPGPKGVRGGRILWALGGKFLVTCGSSKSSQREVGLYRASDLSSPVVTLPLDQSPALLMPFYDADSSTLFLTAKGESTIRCYEVGSDAPYLFPLSHHKALSVHQGICFLPKICCDVRSVEFARALRLTHTTLEPLSFTVPRVKTQLFQDDLFPPTPVLWQPHLSAAEWFNGVNCLPTLLSLQPEDMLPLSGSRDSPPSETTSPRTIAAPHLDDIAPAFSRNLPESVRHAQHKLEQSMSEQIHVTTALVQDCVEGVDANEWLDD